jgi:hypothetical protein
MDMGIRVEGGFAIHPCFQGGGFCQVFLEWFADLPCVRVALSDLLIGELSCHPLD